MAQSAPRFYANIAPGPDFDQHSPTQFTPAYLESWLRRLGGTPDTVGLSFAFSLLNGPLPRIAASTAALQNAAKASGIHILPAFDVQNWWEYRNDLWNWFDPKRPGYKPSNTENVEWTGPGSDYATSIAWRNWGSQIRVAPPPNVRSKAFRAAGEAAFTSIVKPWATWLASKPYGEGVQPVGIKVGWEASLGVNAYVYHRANLAWNAPENADTTTGLQHGKGLFGGLAPLGWAALKSAGKRLPDELQKADIEWIVKDYIQWLVDTSRRCGIPDSLLNTHAGGQFAPYEHHISHTVACAKHAIPGWSLYNTRPNATGDLSSTVLSRKDQRWCCAEWMSFATTANAWADDLIATLTFGDCRFVVAYNTQDIINNQTAYNGLQMAFKRQFQP